MPRQYALAGGVVNETSYGRSYFIPGVGLITESAGTDYDDPITETATLTDTLSVSAGFANAFSDTATLTEATTGGILYADGLTETATLSDAALVGLIFAELITESVTASDAFAIGGIVNASFTESVNLDGVQTVQVYRTARYGEAAYGRCRYADPGTEARPVEQLDVPGSSYVFVSVGVHVSLTEAITASESIRAGLIFAEAITATVTLTDEARLLANFREQSVRHLTGSRLLTAKLNGSI